MSHDPTGILLIDKPKGITSFGVLHQIKKKFGIKKIGHAGTLDPDASGLLIVLLGAATKLQRFITDDKKSYSGEIKLGISTNTDDSTGVVTESKEVAPLTEEALNKALNSFLGEIQQKPPAFSAIKKDGVRAYELARKGKEVLLESRSVTLYDAELKILDEQSLSYRLTCSKGFYVRSFAKDLAAALGTIGITGSIRRESSAGINVGQAHKLEALLEMSELPILSVTDFLVQLERVSCTAEEYNRLILGRSDVLVEIQDRIHSKEEAMLLIENKTFAGVIGAEAGGSRAIEFLVPGLS